MTERDLTHKIIMSMHSELRSALVTIVRLDVVYLDLDTFRVIGANAVDGAVLSWQDVAEQAGRPRPARAPAADATHASEGARVLADGNADMCDIFDDDADMVGGGESFNADDADPEAPDIGDDIWNELRNMLEADGFGSEDGSFADVLNAMAECDAVAREDEVEAESLEGVAADSPAPDLSDIAPQRAVEDPSESYDDLARRLGMSPAPGWAYRRSDTSQDVGYLRALASGQSVKAACRIHNHCSFFLNIEGDFPGTTKRLLRWLHCGHAAATADAHMARKPDF